MAEVVLSKRFQISESLAEERRWVRRGPHAEWPGLVVFIGAVMGVFCCRNAGAGGSTVMGVWLEGDSPVLEEFRWLLSLAAGCGLWRGPALVTTAQS